MHPVIIGQLAADHIGEMHVKAEQGRQARRARSARRRAPSAASSPGSGDAMTRREALVLATEQSEAAGGR